MDRWEERRRSVGCWAKGWVSLGNERRVSWSLERIYPVRHHSRDNSGLRWIEGIKFKFCGSLILSSTPCLSFLFLKSTIRIFSNILEIFFFNRRISINFSNNWISKHSRDPVFFSLSSVSLSRFHYFLRVAEKQANRLFVPTLSSYVSIKRNKRRWSARRNADFRIFTRESGSGILRP